MRIVERGVIAATILTTFVAASTSQGQTEPSAVVSPPQAPDERPAASIVARVDDSIILLDEVLSSVRPDLSRARKQLPPDQYREVEWQYLKQSTRIAIERNVVLKELEAFVPNKEAITKIRRMVTKDFEPYISRVAADQKKTAAQFLDELRKEGMDLNSFRANWVDQVLVQQYLERLIKNQITEPTREELFRYYETHQDEFTDPVGVEWKHVQVRFGANRLAARKKIEEAHARLMRKEDFAVVAKQMSDGPTAVAGGVWSLTSKNSYADESVDEILFTIPIAQISQIIDGKDAYHIVLVDKRNDGTAKTFAEVQDKIRQIMSRDQRTTLMRNKLDELVRKHHVESIFDDDSKVANKPAQKLLK